MWAVGRYDLGLSDAELQGIMPVEFAALMDRWHAEQERLDYRAAFVVSAIYNTIRDPKKKREPFKPDDFIGKPKEKRKQTPDEMLTTVKALNKAFGGAEGVKD